MSDVSRSVYQKLKEENKRLLKDIKTLVDNKTMPTVKQILTIKKWRDKFRKEKEFNDILKLACKIHIKNNPDDPAVIAFHKIHNSANSISNDKH